MPQQVESPCLLQQEHCPLVSCLLPLSQGERVSSSSSPGWFLWLALCSQTLGVLDFGAAVFISNGFRVII